MPPKFALSDKKLQQLLLASGSAVVTAVLSSGADSRNRTQLPCGIP